MLMVEGFCTSLQMGMYFLILLKPQIKQKGNKFGFSNIFIYSLPLFLKKTDAIFTLLRYMVMWFSQAYYFLNFLLIFRVYYQKSIWLCLWHLALFNVKKIVFNLNVAISYIFWFLVEANVYEFLALFGIVPSQLGRVIFRNEE